MTKISSVTQYLPSMNAISQFASNHNVVVPAAIAVIAHVGVTRLDKSLKATTENNTENNKEQPSTIAKIGRTFLTLVRAIAGIAAVGTTLYEGTKVVVAGHAALSIAEAKLPEETFLNQVKAAKDKYPAVKRQVDFYAGIGASTLGELVRRKIGL